MPRSKWVNGGGTFPPSFSRRMASKVISLITKFESMSSPRVEEDSEKVSPPARSIESLVAPTGSISKRALRLRSSFSRRASRLFEKLERDKEENNPPPKRSPPRKKAWVIPRPIDRKQRRRPYPEGHKDGQSERQHIYMGTFRRSRQVENVDDISSIGFDGPISGDEPSALSTNETPLSSQALSTPPIAKILPSSFFTQLMPSEPLKPIKISPLPKVLQDCFSQDISAGESFDPKEFSIGPSTTQKSVWKRKITPPKISVKELILKFRQETEQDTDSRSSSDEEQLAMPTIYFKIEELGSFNLQGDSQKASLNLSKISKSNPPTNSKKSKKIPKSIPNGCNRHQKEKDKYNIDSGVSAVGSSLESASSASHGNNGEHHAALVISLNTKSKEIVGGSKTDFGHQFSAKELPLQQTTVHNNLDALTDDNSYSALARLDTPLPSTKKYRKTPPPKGFFRRFGCLGYSVSVPSSLAIITSESESEDDISELSSLTGTGSVYSTANTSTKTTIKTEPSSRITIRQSRNINRMKYPTNHGFTIRTSIQAMPVLTPVPINAMQNVALKRLIRQYTYY